MTVKLLYFATLREQIGRAEEHVELPANVATVADVLTWLAARGPEYAAALERRAFIRAAVDQVHASPSTPVRDAREVALFPPMTGG